MGVQKIKYRDGKVQYRVQIRRKHFVFDSVVPKRDLADQLYLEKMREAIGHKHPELAAETKMTFNEFFVIYENRKKKSLRGWEKYEHYWNEFKEFFGEQEITAIDSNDIEDYKARLENAQLSPGTILRKLTALSGIFSAAIKWKYRKGTNPVWEVEKPTVDDGRLRFLERSEFAKLLEHCDDSTRDDKRSNLHDIVVLAVNTGLRKEELQNINIEKDVDFSRKILHLPKTKKGKYDNIPLNEVALATLKKQRSNQPFAYEFRRPYENAVIKAKLKDVNFHTLRHTFASWLVQKGVDIYTVMRLMRHSDMKMTQRYAHLGDQNLAKAVAHILHIDKKGVVVSA